MPTEMYVVSWRFSRISSIRLTWNIPIALRFYVVDDDVVTTDVDNGLVINCEHSWIHIWYHTIDLSEEEGTIKIRKVMRE